MTTVRNASAATASILNPGPGIAAEVDRFMDDVVARNPYEVEFHQAVREVAESVMPLVLDDHRYQDARILERMSEPERVVSSSSNTGIRRRYARLRTLGMPRDCARASFVRLK